MTFAPFLRAFSMVTLLLIGSAAGYVVAAGPDLPAPHLSRSASFNEKARWLREALGRERRCDVLAVGSSMALNSLDAGQLAHPGERVINAGSFGVTPEDTVRLLGIILPLCRPRLIVMASYQGDFAPAMPDDKEIAWPALASYLSGGSPWRAHRADFDPYYLLERSWREDEHRRRDIYTSLAFDPSGSVGLDCTGFRKDAARWNGDQHDAMAKPKAESLDAIAAVARLARQAGARFALAVVPLRPRAETAFHPARRDALWRAVEGRIAPYGGALIWPAGNATFTDAEFADYAHLNRCGAQRWTALLRDTLAREGLE